MCNSVFRQFSLGYVVEKLTRAVKSLQKISKEIELLIDDLTDDGFEEYADNLQLTLDKLSTVLFGLTNEDPLRSK